MPKLRIYDSGMKVLKTLEYLHNLEEPPTGQAKIHVTIAGLVKHLTDNGEKATRDTAKSILDAIHDSEIGYPLEWTRTKKGHIHYWYHRTFSLEEISLLSTIITSSMFLSEEQIKSLLQKLRSLTSQKNAPSLSTSEHFLRPRMMNNDALNNLRIIHEAINNKQALTFYIGSFDSDKNIYYDKPLHDESKECTRTFPKIIVEKTKKKKNIKIPKKSPDQGKQIICYPYRLAWDNSRCYLICGIEKDDHIYLWNYRVDRMFELKPSNKEGYRYPRSSQYYDYDGEKESIDAEHYMHSIFKMFTSEKPANVTLRFTKNLTSIIFEKFGFDVNIHSIDDYYSEVTVEVQISQQFYGWLAGFKANDLKLVAPEQEVTEYIRYLNECIKEYELQPKNPSDIENQS